MFHQYDLTRLFSDERKTHRTWIRRIALFYAGVIGLLLAVETFTSHATRSGFGEAKRSTDLQQRKASFEPGPAAREIQLAIPSCDNDPDVHAAQCSHMPGDQSP
jgi:hypothetical protein